MNSSIATADGSDALPAVLVSLKSDPSCHRMFRPGQPLTADGVLPNQLLLILEGQARLLPVEREQPATLCKLGSGDVVGLASLISAAPCETVHASTSLKAPASASLKANGHGHAQRQPGASVRPPAPEAPPLSTATGPLPAASTLAPHLPPPVAA